MVEMSLNGRLGNQLFMYAIARTAQIESGSNEIYFNTSTIEAENCANSLNNYCLYGDVHFYSEPLRTLKNSLHAPFYKNYIFMKVLKRSVKKRKPFSPDFLNRIGFFIDNGKFQFFNFSKKNYVLLHGYFQCERFFEKHRDVILKEFTPKYPVLPHNIDKINKIKNSESVCVSLRLGEDYQKNEMYSVCTLKYFKNAIQYMKDKLDNPVFYVFSDITEGLSDLFDNDPNMIFETGNDPDYEKLRIMSSCKHFIISNSSFSWWAQYLGDNKNKIVVSPDRWYNLGVETDIMMDSWIKLET